MEIGGECAESMIGRGRAHCWPVLILYLQYVVLGIVLGTIRIT